MAAHTRDRAAGHTAAGADLLRGKPSLPMIGLLVVQLIIGYEWFISGLVKIVRGNFPSGLAGELLAKSKGAPEWYVSFLNGTIIPNSEVFGYLIQTSEILAGVALITAAFLWLFAWDRISDWLRSAVLFFTAVAAIGGAILAINLHIANGSAHPWLLPESGFDEGIDLDSILPAIQIVLAVVSIIFLKRLRRERTDTGY